MKKVMRQIKALNSKDKVFISALFLIGFAFMVPQLAIGSGFLKLTAQPTHNSIVLKWESDISDVTSYRIQRAHLEEEGIYSSYETIIEGTVDNFNPTVKGSTHYYSFNDAISNYEASDPLKLEDRTAYSYKVIAIKEGAIVKSSKEIKEIILASSNNPHGMYGKTTDLCRICHSTNAQEQKGLIPKEVSQLCLSCHSENNHPKKVVSADFKHDITSEVFAELEIQKLSCTDCHNPHGSKNGQLIKEGLGDFTTISDAILKERAFCTSCHAYANNENEMSTFRGIEFRALPYDETDQRLEQHLEAPEHVTLKKCSECHGTNESFKASAHAPLKGDQVLVPFTPMQTEEPLEGESGVVGENAEETTAKEPAKEEEVPNLETQTDPSRLEETEEFSASSEIN